MNADSDIPLQLMYVLIFLLMVINALTTAARKSLDSIDRNKIKEMQEDLEDSKKINRVIKLLKQPAKYRYADMAVSYIVTIACVLIANYTVFAGFELKWLIVGNLLFGFLLIGLSDFFPNKLATQDAENFALHLSFFQNVICVVMFIPVKICMLLANLLLRFMGKETRIDESGFSENKVMSMLDQGQESGSIKEEGRKMIDSIFAFDDLIACEIMTPRTDVLMIDVDDPPEEYIPDLMEMRYSRIPLYENDPDNIIGTLHIRDYMRKAAVVGVENVNIRELARESYFVPETKNVDSLLVEMQRNKQRISYLVDEYGGFSGIVSIEDIIEQIVGDIDDEFDEADRVIERISENEYIVDGNVYLDDLDEETGIELISDNSETIGGFIIELTGEIPKSNDGLETVYEPIEYKNYIFTILEVKDRRIEKIHIAVKTPDPKEKSGIDAVRERRI